MFGHQDNQSSTQNDQADAAQDTQDNATDIQESLSSGDQNASDSNSLGTIGAVSSVTPDGGGKAWQHPGEALDEASSKKEDVISPAGGFPQALSSRTPVLTPPATSTNAAPALTGSTDENQLTDATNEELIEVKQKALDELFPLIDKLNQTPGEHFRTLMMIIQASDNHTLIEKAYQVAQTIDDEKDRAQALLDIVNEINYFTQQPEV